MNNNFFRYDIAVIGGTPAGIACAVRAARSGCSVLLTQHTMHLGGMCTNGLGQWDALSNHRRCAIFREVLDRLETHYRETFGEGSPNHVAAQYKIAERPAGCYEPSVIERIFSQMVEGEAGITVWLGFYPESVECDGTRVLRAAMREMTSDECRTVEADVFVDATYEADLAALAGVKYRVGREAQDEFGEPHAGRLYTRIETHNAPQLAVDGVINLHPYAIAQGAIDPDSPRTADAAVQAYNTRACVSNDPNNRILPERPPENYDRSEFVDYRPTGLHIGCFINGKNSYNAPILPGQNWDYPEGDWATRERITQRHHDFALGMMYFLQNDTFIPAGQREEFRQWGLPADEFIDNNHMPYEMYVRETRRIIGRHILTELDLSPREGLMRPRSFPDSIAFTDWYMDSHSCSRDLGTYGPGNNVMGTVDYPYEGKLILTDELLPGMIPYRCLIPESIDNLIVPVCASSTHVTWGAIRLEPVWIHLGEVAGFAAALSIERKTTPADLDVTLLQCRFLDAGGSIAFLNQHEALAESANRAELELAACHDELDTFGASAGGNDHPAPRKE